MQIVNDWDDYELIDAGEGEKLERWGLYILRRPDPQAVWPKKLSLKSEWDTAQAIYDRSSTGGGKWNLKKPLPEKWYVNYRDLRFVIRPTGFKHTGLFPEQAVNWNFLMQLIRDNKARYDRKIKVLNLFGYTGAATVACTMAGAGVCHVDASKQILGFARENLQASGLANEPVRLIPEDALNFVKKEFRRGNKYDIILMDPPTFGRGDKGQVWKIEKDLNALVENCMAILSDQPLAFIINTYVNGLTGCSLNNLLKVHFGSSRGGEFVYDELGIPLSQLQVKESGLILPAGVFARWNYV